MISFEEFIQKYDGKVLDTDGYYGGQCLDEMHGHLNQVLDLPLSLFAAPTAYEAWQNANDPRFDKIPNTPTGVPVKGDIMFWKPNVSGVTGSAGHVASFISGDANSFVSFDQNYPTGTPCHKQSHNYDGVAGWLHFKQSPQPTPPSNDDTQVQFDRGLTYLKSISVTDSDRREDYFGNDKYLQALKSLHNADQLKALEIVRLNNIIASTPSGTPQKPISLPKPLPKSTPNWLVTFINKLQGK